jgi:hypothetical protein
MTPERYFVLREIEINIQDIKVGDIFRMEGTAMHSKALFFATESARKEGDTYHLPSQIVGLIQVGFEYNMTVKSLNIGLKSQNQERD